MGSFRTPLKQVKTIGGTKLGIGEPFGVVESNGSIYVSDGEKGEIYRVRAEGTAQLFASGLHTPSQMAFDGAGNLIVADSGNHSIKKVGKDGSVTTLAGKDSEPGFVDGAAADARFHAPIGIAIEGERIFVADTYNDRIRVIENGTVRTVAGGKQGFIDSKIGTTAEFDTPCGIAIWREGRLLIADAGNARIRVLEPDGRVWTLSGNDGRTIKDGFIPDAEFVEPRAIAVNVAGEVFIADGNAIRAIRNRAFPILETISSKQGGFNDGKVSESAFRQPSGLAFDKDQNLLVADAANQLVRAVTSDNPMVGTKLSKLEFEESQISAKEFRKLSPPRWTFDPPDVTRDIAGTLGEIRGEIAPDKDAWFHNGLDIAGEYGETARFVRDGKVLRPNAVTDFDTVREAVRLPTLGYIHIRLGRDKNQNPYEDRRFLFSKGDKGALRGVRIPRGSIFKAGEAIGTLNSYNHVHLIAGRSGHEMNALAALNLPGVKDTRAPKIESVELFTNNWKELVAKSHDEPILVKEKVRIVAQGFDQMDGNPERRKLGLYKIGYQVYDEEGNVVTGFEKPKWTIVFDLMPTSRSVAFCYAEQSRSGATGETRFRYIVTNSVRGDAYKEDFLDVSSFRKGKYKIGIIAADYYGNETVYEKLILKD